MLVQLPHNSCIEKSLGFPDLCKKIIPVNPCSQQSWVGEGKEKRGGVDGEAPASYLPSLPHPAGPSPQRLPWAALRKV